ncbi:site-specific DNA-methyltransferase [Nitratireductor pacificus]|uniref:Methyltransferase n=1 Tax=Nitratireductor pacificus pht-3B TaxID=391937 RepID=K2MYP4_9HYPH|nr:site-specific DNA-methyltransferase [Nitratireductor pacificus]EKF17088.1 DNA methylase N-4/N-6 domain-containing protein [Nitratireductor pacificus pht-3B]
MEVRRFLDDRVTLYLGDCLEVLDALPENSIDSVVCDPPYHLTSIVKRFGAGEAAAAKAGATGAFKRASAGFMGKQWDGGDVAFRSETWAKVLRVLKPGGYLLAFASTRGFGRMSVAIEDAGFITHPFVAWVFGSGFPKATRIKADGYDGFRYGGQALKPAIEPVYMGQKPFEKGLSGTQNILKWGTGALNIDGCRVFGADQVAASHDEATQDKRYTNEGGTNFAAKPGRRYSVKRLKPGASLKKTGGNWRPDGGEDIYEGELKPGRWPANLIHDGSEEVLKAFPAAPGALREVNSSFAPKSGTAVYGDYGPRQSAAPRDSGGSAARFFYQAKADANDRIGSRHPTVKPLDLMQYLCRMVTPPGGTILDPFAGTGTTGEAAWREGNKAILIEREPEYQADIARRMDVAANPMKRAAVAKGEPKGAEGTPLFGGGEAAE